MRDVQLVIRFTRNWIHYGFLTHTTLCILIAAGEGLIARDAAAPANRVQPAKANIHVQWPAAQDRVWP